MSDSEKAEMNMLFKRMDAITARIAELKSEISVLQTEQKELSGHIVGVLKEKKLEDRTIRTKKKEYQVRITRRRESISQKFLVRELQNILELSEDDTKQIVKKIYDARKVISNEKLDCADLKN